MMHHMVGRKGLEEVTPSFASPCCSTGKKGRREGLLPKGDRGISCFSNRKEGARPHTDVINGRRNAFSLGDGEKGKKGKNEGEAK